MLAFDHCYTSDRGHRFLARLADAGFSLDPSTVEHPGRHVCRFIPFATPGDSTRQYLEFISKPKSQGNKPGLSLSPNGRLDDHYDAIRRDRFLRPTFEHRNYDWKSTGETVRTLGWNFVHFRRELSAAEIWLTEYERPDGKKPRWKVKPRHPNGALGIVGVIWEVNSSGRRYFERVLGRRITKSCRLSCGTGLVLAPATRNRFRGVLIKVTDFRRFCSRARPDEICLRSGRKTAVLKNPSGSWDILVI